MIDLNRPQQIIVKTLAGCEPLLEEELNALGCRQVTKLTRAVMLEGTWDEVYKINYASRFALNVLVNISNFTVKNYDDIYAGARKVFWHEFMNVDQTFAIKHAVNSPAFSHSQLCALKVKDAIVDGFMDKYQKRPSVNKDAPDFIFHIHISGEKCQLLIDTSGRPLYQRGYKVYQGIAPLNEILAAAMVKWLNWDASKPLVDPFCGSGTILIEAYLQAINRPAGYYRKQYAFMRLKGFNRANWESLKQQFNALENREAEPMLTAYEINERVAEGAQKNFAAVGMQNIKCVKADFFTSYEHDEEVYLATNPPYGKRIEPMDDAFYTNFSKFLKHSCSGARVGVLAPVELIKRLGFKPVFKANTFNGDIECQYVAFKLFAGSRSGSNLK